MDFEAILNESRALPGGMLNSKEHTEYEDWHEELLKNIDKKKQDKDSCPMVLFDSEGGANGYHNNDGTPIEKKDDKEKIFATCYYENMGLGSLYRVLEDIQNISNLKFKLSESENDTEKMKAEMDRHIKAVAKSVKELDFITNKDSPVIGGRKTASWVEGFEELCLKIIEAVDAVVRNSTIPNSSKRDIIENANDALDIAGMEATKILINSDYIGNVKYHRNGMKFNLMNYKNHKTIRNLFVNNKSNVSIA